VTGTAVALASTLARMTAGVLTGVPH